MSLSFDGKQLAAVCRINALRRLLCCALPVLCWGGAGALAFRRVPSASLGRLRASVPLAAGVFHMPYWHFQLANFTSAFFWAGVLLGVGDVVTIVFEWVSGRMGGAL